MGISMRMAQYGKTLILKAGVSPMKGKRRMWPSWKAITPMSIRLIFHPWMQIRMLTHEILPGNVHRPELSALCKNAHTQPPVGGGCVWAFL